MGNIFGMVGSGSWQTDAKPGSWRESILYYWPNGMTSLTGMLSKIPTEPIDSDVHHWWIQEPPVQGGVIAAGDVKLDAALANPYVTGGVVGQQLWVKVSAAIAGEIKPGHVVQLSSQTYFRATCNALVDTVSVNGVNSKLGIHLLEADDNDTVDNKDLSDADYIVVIGSGHSQGAPTPKAIAYEPEGYYNLVQDFRNSIYLTELAQQVRTRYGSKEYLRLKKDTQKLHGIEMEKATWFGVRHTEQGENNQPRMFMGGIRWWVQENAGSVYMADFRRAAAYSGKKWTDADGGKHWLAAMTEQYARYAEDENWIGFGGSRALNGINQLAEIFGQVNLETRAEAYGIKIRTWVTAEGELSLKTHPLFSQHPPLRHMIYFVGPKSVRFRPVRNMDTRFRTNRQSRGETARLDEFETVGTLEFGAPKHFMVLAGVGEDNVV